MNNRYISRGKRKDNGEWVTGYYVFQRKRSGVFGQKISELDFDRHLIIDLRGNSHEVIPETVVRCTGLKDKNGKPIFEGDIVEADGYIFFVNFGKCGGVANNEDYGYIGYYLDGYDEITKKVLSYGLRDDICYFTNIEAIGNIHDNPELLQRSDEE